MISILSPLLVNLTNDFSYDPSVCFNTCVLCVIYEVPRLCKMCYKFARQSFLPLSDTPSDLGKHKRNPLVQKRHPIPSLL